MARTRAMAGMAAVGAALLLAACGGAATNRLSGEVVLRSPDDIALGEEGGQEACAGAAGSGYEDIIGGEEIVVFNPDGEPVARATLGLGQPSDGGAACTFPWEIAELPEADAYAIAIGDREPVPYTLDELRQDDFRVVLSLNDPGA